MRLSIIIPYYNTEDYTNELLKVLDNQITDEVEVILIDDGSDKEFIPKYEWLTVVRTNNQGQAKARNLGINSSVGEYIQFIDSDDMVSEDFVEKILTATEEGKDLIEFSWKSLNSERFNFRITNRSMFPGVVLRTFKRSYIGETRFNEKKDAAEDEDFSRRMGYLTEPVEVTIISDYLYFYRDEVEGSNVKSFKAGLKNTKRVIYYVPHMEKGSEYIDQIKKDDETNEVILLTNQNDVPELKRLCQIYRPQRMWAHFAKGYNYPLEIIPLPIKSKVMLYINQLHVIGGIETFIYHFARLMYGKYEVTLVVGNCPESQRERYEKYIKVVPYTVRDRYICDTLINVRILDRIPANFNYKQSVQMVHACKTNPQWHIRQNTDYIVNVSQTGKDSFEDEAKDAVVIHNPIFAESKRALILVSATRIPAPDKGDNEKRMRRLAEMLNDANIPFVWFNFSEGQIPNPPRGMVNMGLEMDIQPYIAIADYLVQLSDSECWSYSILEALTNRTAVIVTPFPSGEEMGISDGMNGYIVPYDMNFDVTKLLNIPQFKYVYDNENIKKQWARIFSQKQKRRTKWDVQVIQKYHDIDLDQTLEVGQIISMPVERAKKIIDLGYVKLKGDT